MPWDTLVIPLKKKTHHILQLTLTNHKYYMNCFMKRTEGLKTGIQKTITHQNRKQQWCVCVLIVGRGMGET